MTEAVSAGASPPLVIGARQGSGGPEGDPSVGALRAAFGDAVRGVRSDAIGVPVVSVDPKRAFDILRYLKEDAGQTYDFLADLTAVDLGGGSPLRLWYQLWSMRHGRQLRLEAELPLDDLEIASVTPLWYSADWMEREAYDMFGVTFRGHADLRRLLMPENYEEGFPLRKDFPLRGRFSRAEQTRRALSRDLEDLYAREELEMAGVLPDRKLRDIPPDRRPEQVAGCVDHLEGERMLLNLGPQHPGTHGVLRLVLELDGERIIRCIPHIGYLHTGFEKTCEYREWNQVVPYTDRMDYLSPMLYNIGYALAVESLMGIEITPRCRAVRVLLGELNRILGHLLWLGTTAIDLGAFSVFLYTFEERERIYNLHEAYCGARLTTSVTRVGGMLADLPAGWLEAVRDFVDTLPHTLYEVDRLLTRNAIWISRQQDIGVIGPEDAVSFGLTGPNLRASGVAYDVRKARPYLGYDEYEFDVPVGEHGDSYDRFLVRFEEIRQSLRILQQVLDMLPDGPINIDDPSIILPPKSEAMGSIDTMIAHFKLVMEGLTVPPGEVWYSIEGSKGELGFGLVSDGGTKPVRCRFRGPCLLNLAALPMLVEGGLVADVLAVNASLDIVLGEIDR